MMRKARRKEGSSLYKSLLFVLFSKLLTNLVNVKTQRKKKFLGVARDFIESQPGSWQP